MESNIILVGMPASGKTTIGITLAQKLQTHTLIDTDSLIEKTEGLDLSDITVMSDIDGMLQNNYYEFNLKNSSSTTVGYILSIINDDSVTVISEKTILPKGI